MARTYTTIGDIRGECGHRHRTLRTAAICYHRDSVGCDSHGGYSDRRLVVEEGNDIVTATHKEMEEYNDTLYRMSWAGGLGHPSRVSDGS